MDAGDTVAVYDQEVITAIDNCELAGRVGKDEAFRTVAHVRPADLEAWRAANSSSVDPSTEGRP